MPRKLRVSLSVSALIAVALLAVMFGQRRISAARAVATVLQDSPNIPEMDAGGCQHNSGLWSSTQQGIPGDGNPHNFAVNAPNGAAEFLGGTARGFRQTLDQSWSFTCTINPVQPPTVANSQQRRCTPPGDDMSVEKCTATSGSTGTLFCEYVNSTNAPPKMVELGGCWKKGP